MSDHVGRRVVLGGIGTGVLAIVTGGRFLPRFDLPFSGGGWRIYNVAGRVPSPAGFSLRVDGLVDRPVELDLRQVLALPHHEQVADFECVTGWRVEDVRWRGVRIGALLDLAGARAEGSHLTFHSRDGVYVDSLSRADATADETVLVTEMDGEPLPRRHGGPLRLIVPSMYGYKSVKWVGRVEVTDQQVVGYWQQRGYAEDARIDAAATVEVYRGRETRVPGIPYAVAVPPGWEIRPLGGGGALLVAPDQGGDRVEASVTVTRSPQSVDREEARRLLASLERAGLTEPRYGTVRARELTADTLAAEDGSGQRFLFAFFADDERVVQVQGQAPARRWSSWEPWFEQLAASLRRR